MTLMMRDIDNRRIGEKEGRYNLIKDMLSRGKTAKEISEFCGIDINEVNAVADSMLLEKAGIQ